MARLPAAEGRVQWARGGAGELSSVLNTTGQTQGSEVDRVLVLTRFLHFNFYPATSGPALLPVVFKESF